MIDDVQRTILWHLAQGMTGPPDSPSLSALIAALEERIEHRMDRLESKIDLLIDGHAGVRERLARLEGEATGRSGSAA